MPHYLRKSEGDIDGSCCGGVGGDGRGDNRVYGDAVP